MPLLRRQREAADRAYNDALTAIDKAVRTLRTWPPAPPSYDDSQIHSLNTRWELLSAAPSAGGGWRGRLRTLVWGIVAPIFERQQNFNAALVDHANRNVASHREGAEALAALLESLRDEFARYVDFQSLLVQYAQTVTAYVDTKDRYVEARPHTLEQAVNALGDDVQKRWESMVARERRLHGEVDEIRSTLAVAHRAILTLKHELELVRSTPPLQSDPGSTPSPQPAGSAPASSVTPSAIAASQMAGSSLDSYKYVGFEDQFRGTPDDISDRMRGYVADFDGSQDVLDVGCGRGEFLALLRERGIGARGIDINSEMVATCRDRGLDATVGDALGYLEAQPDASLGGLFAAQVVEHLQPDYLLRLLDAAARKLRPGSLLVLETINPACWFAFFSSYIRDITHVRPLHPETLRYLVLASGFQRVEVRYLSPYPEAYKLQPVAMSEGGSWSAAAATLNDNVEKLNSLFFTFLDYAIVARRG